VLRSIATQVITTYNNYYQPLIPYRVHLIFERGLRGERLDLTLYVEQGNIWYLLITFLVWRGRIEPTTSRSQGERTSTETPLRPGASLHALHSASSKSFFYTILYTGLYMLKTTITLVKDSFSFLTSICFCLLRLRMCYRVMF